MLPEVIHRAEDVFGTNRNRDVPLNYVIRKSADERLIDSLPRGKHLVIYGSSKQGKTCLRKHCLNPEDYIVVHCSNKWAVSDVNLAILKEAGYELSQSTVRTTTGQAKVTAKAGFKLFGTGAEATTEASGGLTKADTRRPLELDPVDVNDIIRALNEIHFSKFIILEDFHYLPTDTQRDFAISLKAYHENSKLCFIIVGVWLEDNRLTVYNGDLTGRVLSIDADKWTDDELLDVIKAGEELLNVNFDPTFKKTLVEACYGGVYLVQEACYRACVESKVFETSPQPIEVGMDLHPEKIIKQVVNDESGRYRSFLTQFALGFEDTTLSMYKWLLYPVITSDVKELEKGLSFRVIRQKIQAKHPRGTELNAANVLNALNYSASLQVKKNVRPLILDYDESNSQLRVVDRGFLIWLSMQDRDALLELVDLPAMS